MAGENNEKEVFLSLWGEFFYPGFYTKDQIEEARGTPLTVVDKNTIPDIINKSGSLKQFQNFLQKKRDIEIKNRPKEILETTRIFSFKPSSYYAILTMDGDHMGKFLDNNHDKKEHIKISQCLTCIAAEMRRRVEEKYPGIVVYCGGDDVLALFSANCVLAAADDLRKAFTDGLTAAGFSEKHVSSGIAIVHHQSPLSTTIASAREALAEAKGRYRRNAICVRLLRRSGEFRQTGMHWWDKDTMNPVEEVEMRMVLDELGNNLVGDVLSEAPVLDTPAFCAELERLIRRHSNPKIWRSKQEQIDLAERLASLLDYIEYSDIYDGHRQIAHWLEIARFMAAGG